MIVGKGSIGYWLDLFMVVSCINIFVLNIPLQNGQKFSCRTDQLLSSSFGLEVDSSSVKKVWVWLWVWSGAWFIHLLLYII